MLNQICVKELSQKTYQNRFQTEISSLWSQASEVFFHNWHGTYLLSGIGTYLLSGIGTYLLSGIGTNCINRVFK